MGEKAQGRVILDRCGGTGGWSRPYVEAGYDVRVVTLPAINVRDYTCNTPVHGVLAAPPCTQYAGSGARWWAGKAPELLAEANEIVRACLRIIDETAPEWWALENPVGRLRKYLGPHVMTFNPSDYGGQDGDDPYTKRTCL